MGNKKRTRPRPFNTGWLSRIAQRTAESDHAFLQGYLLPLVVSITATFLSVSSFTYAANPNVSGSPDSKGKAPVVLNIVPEKSEFECVACVIWFMCVSVRMSATEGEFRTIPASVNGNSQGYMIIYTDTLKTINQQVADKIKKTYLETQKYPEIRFTLTDLRGERESILFPQRNRFRVAGILNLHGVEKEIVFYPDIFLHDDVLAFEGETLVRLTEFNIKIPRFMFLKVKDEIAIRFNVAWECSPPMKNASAEVAP